MISEWVLYLLWAIIGILGSGTFWYFLSQKNYYAALWTTFSVFILVGLTVTLYIRNSLIQQEIQANTPMYFGELTPGTDSAPPIPLNVPSNTVSLLLGNNVVLAAQSKTYILSKDEKPFLSISIENRGMKISATIVDSKNNYIARVIDNEFQINPINAFNPKQPDKHSLVVRDIDGVEVLHIRYLNPTAISVLGRFWLPRVSEPILILPEGLRLPGGSRLSNATIDVTRSKAGALEF
jgi:hypothetical protein